MEKEKTEVQQHKRKIQIGSNGGGNIGGLVLLGGALAVGSLVAILATRKGKRRKDSDDSCNKKEDQQSQRKEFILQTSSPTVHGNQCCASNGSMEMVSADNLMLGEDSASAVKSSLQNSENNDQEIVITHDLRQDSIDMRNNHCFSEEFQSPELNVLPLDELDKDAKNDEATIEVAEEDAAEEITAVKPGTAQDDDDKEGKKQAKGSSILEENIEVAEKEEQTTVEIGAEKEDDGKFGKELPLKEMIEVKQEEALHKVEEQDAIDAAKISMVEIPSVQSDDGDDDDNKSKEENKQVKEKLLLEGKIKVEEEEPICVKSCEEIPALSIIEKEDGDDDFKRGFPSMKDIKLKQEAIDRVAENYVMEEKSSTKATEGDDDEAEKRHSADEKDDEHDFNTERSSKGSAASEIWPAELVEETPLNTLINAQLSELKTTEQDENTKTKDFEHFNCSNSDSIIRDFALSKKKGKLEYADWNKRPAINSMKWRISVDHMLIKASTMLLFFIAMHCLFYLLCNNIVIR